MPANPKKLRLDSPPMMALALVALPALVYYLWICVHHFGGALAWPFSRDLAALLPAPTLAAAAIYGLWLLFQGFLQLYAPGPWKEGVPMDADGTRLRFRLNGWFSFWFTWVFLLGAMLAGVVSPTIVYDHFGALLTTANLFAFVFCAYLYTTGRRSAKAHRSGSRVGDYFLGTLKQPRPFGSEFDFKFFCEGRPGLIGWTVVDFSLAAKQFQLHGTLSTPMLLVLAFQFLYVVDYFYHEEAILTTWDMVEERFGWMLCWGCLVWVPFTYSLQAYYLVNHAHELPFWGTAFIVALNLFGYYVFRSSNLQKHRFRTDPTRPIWGRAPEFIRTQRGTLLLTSGFWGIGRHVNYFGDLMMALAWCLPCLFAHPLPYFYVVYFTILLIQRERRDHRKCLDKYGSDWVKYCRQVRWRIVPFVY